MAQKKENKTTSPTPEFVFGKNNYKVALLGIAILALGFILMIGKENIFDFRKITLAPIVIVAGFITIGYSILIKPKK